MEKEKIYWKITNPDGTSFHDGRIKYEVGKTVEKRKCINPQLCSPQVLHASENLLDALKYAKIPLAIHKVSGESVVHDETKDGFFSLNVLETITDNQYDKLLGFKYHEALNPVNPTLLTATPTEEDWNLVETWASVLDSVRDSVRASVLDSVWDSVRDSVRVSVRVSVWVSVLDSLYAYIGSLFPSVKRWKYVEHDEGVYPFQPSANLWKKGFVPIRIDAEWKLASWNDGKCIIHLKPKRDGE